MTERDEKWTEDERRALDAWTAPEPPADFAERVLARAAGRSEEPETPPRAVELGSRRLRVGLGIAIAAGVAAALVLVPARPEPAKGELAAEVRTSVTLGTRGIAVGEAGAALSWVIDAEGAAEVRQDRGNTFYRVERGGPFRVITPAGEVRVVGTCFRVEVEEMKASSAGLIGAGAGAALAATVLVTVYEGKVVTASPEGGVELAAGEAARMSPARAPERVAPRLGGERAEAPIAASQAVVVEKLPEGLSPGELYAAHAKLAKEAEALRGEVEALRARLASGQETAHQMLDLPPDELQRMASRCELRWDMQGLRAEAESMNPRDAEKLQLSDGEREVIDRVLAENHARIVKELHAIYVEVTGDNTAGSLAPMSMFEEINDKAPEGEIQKVFQTLSRERAGLAAAPVDRTGRSPWERLYRLMTTAGDALEQGVARELGPDVARAYRKLNGGFGSKSRSSSGCPKGSAGE